MIEFLLQTFLFNIYETFFILGFMAIWFKLDLKSLNKEKMFWAVTITTILSYIIQNYITTYFLIDKIFAILLFLVIFKVYFSSEVKSIKIIGVTALIFLIMLILDSMICLPVVMLFQIDIYAFRQGSLINLMFSLPIRAMEVMILIVLYKNKFK